MGISYDLPEHLTAYATYGKGSLFSPVSQYGSGANPLAGTETAPTPEIVHMYEAGLRYDTPSLYLSADYFYQKVNDGFSFYQDYLTQQSFYANLGGFIVRGVEVAGKAELPAGFSMSGNFSYNNTDYTDSAFQFVTLANDQFGYAYHGTPFSNTPSYLANIALDYDRGPWHAEVSGQYTGREYQTTDILTPNDPTSQLSGATITDLNNTNDPNFIVNLNASYKFKIQNRRIKSLKLTFTALNVLGVHYYTYKYNSEIAQGGVYSILPQYESGLIGPPRSLQLDLVARF
ncbi:MAG: TonB-dependent receptor [Proteobacteria bacterium]|nr:TonB-dependent receptor [Pseudomonadota bacterium]